jgi:8-oxo-dGTP diphosphatase
MKDWPEYACAILEDGKGRLLLESRPGHARFAAGKLTCFGGRREDGESPEQCLRRELREELNWEPAEVEKRIELWIAGAPKAWFFHASLDTGFDLSGIAPGHRGVFVSKSDLLQLPVSPWHAAVLATWLSRGARVELDV